MLQAAGSPLLRLQVLQAGVGCIHHAAGLISALAGSGDAAAAGPAAAVEAAAAGGGGRGSSAGGGRSISTTRSIYMGRVFLRENLVKSAAKSSLFTRDNYQFLAQQRWSLAACEQVLRNHQGAPALRPRARGRAARSKQQFDPINRTLIERIHATTSLDELRALVEQELHNMTTINMAVVVQRVPRLLHTRSGEPDYAAAALLLDHMASRLQPRLPYLGGANICACLASFARCRYSPSAELLQQMVDELLANNSAKLDRAPLLSLAQLLSSVSRLMQPQGQWPLLSAVLNHTTARLQATLAEQQPEQQQQQQLQSGEEAGGQQQAADAGGEPQQQRQQHQQQGARPAASVAQLAFLLDRNHVQSSEFLDALHAWMAEPANLSGLHANGVLQLWGAARGQFLKHRRSLAGADAAGGERDAVGAGGGVAGDAGDDDAPLAAAAAEAALPEQQEQLRQFFGAGALESLAAATAQCVPHMTERELGQVLSAVSALRFADPDLMAALAAGYERVCAATQPSLATQLSAAWAAVQLGDPRPALLQPALSAAATRPQDLEGYMAGWLLSVCMRMGPELVARHERALAQELHERSGARGPAPEPPAAGAGAGRNPTWVDAVAADVAGRVDQLKPRELARVLSAFSSIPGVALHEPLFAAASRHIQTHAHAFTQFRDMELIAAAFEHLSFRDGLPALKALQAQMEALSGEAGRP